MTNLLKVTDKNGLRIIQFNNPKKKNAMDRKQYEALTKLLEDSGKDDSVKIVAITGQGKVYSSGNDISSAFSQAQGDQDMDQFLKENAERIFRLVRAFYTFPKLLIAVVNGLCIGIAATTAALCDFIYCEENAYFYTPFSQLGLCAEACSSYTFPRIMGQSKATQMLLLNHKMTAQEALQCNFVGKLFKLAEIDKVWKEIEGFLELPKGSLKATKGLMKKFDLEILEKANQNEKVCLVERFKSEESFEAMMKFMSRKNKL